MFILLINLLPTPTFLKYVYFFYYLYFELQKNVLPRIKGDLFGRACFLKCTIQV